MRYPAFLRLLITALALLAGTSSAALAVAHGVSHAREATASTDHHHLPDDSSDAGDLPGIHPLETHGHPILQVAVAKRLGNEIIAAPAPVIAALPSAVEGTEGVSSAVDGYFSDGRATGPPPRLRAPPLR
jgi:hypothetical protein